MRHGMNTQLAAQAPSAPLPASGSADTMQIQVLSTGVHVQECTACTVGRACAGACAPASTLLFEGMMSDMSGVGCCLAAMLAACVRGGCAELPALRAPPGGAAGPQPGPVERCDSRLRGRVAPGCRIYTYRRPERCS